RKREAGRPLLGNQLKRCAQQRLLEVAMMVAARPLAGPAAVFGPAHVNGLYMSRPAASTAVDGGRASAYRAELPLIVGYLEFPTFGDDHLLESDALHALGVAHKRDLSVLGAARMLVSDHRPICTAILGHRDHKWIATIDAFVRLLFVVVRGH